MDGRMFGQYRVTGFLGEGGMGAVYAAEHTLLAKPAAIKVLLSRFSAEEEIVNRFFNEARAASSIRHPGIVEVYDFGWTDGSAYIAMERLEGETLRARRRRGLLRWSTALALARQVAGALGAAHAKGITHRDLKPDNIFLVPDPEVPGGERIKLLDFGIAKLASGVAGQQRTRTGMVMGTPLYMAPEQCRGVAVDARADLYSLGCILFELCTGRPPFDGEGEGDLIAAHIHLQPPRMGSLVSGIPREIESLVQRLLAKAPAERVQTAAELIRLIDAARAAISQAGMSGQHPALARSELGTESDHGGTDEAERESTAAASAVARRARRDTGSPAWARSGGGALGIAAAMEPPSSPRVHTTLSGAAGLISPGNPPAAPRSRKLVFGISVGAGALAACGVLALVLAHGLGGDAGATAQVAAAPPGAGSPPAKAADPTSPPSAAAPSPSVPSPSTAQPPVAQPAAAQPPAGPVAPPPTGTPAETSPSPSAPAGPTPGPPSSADADPAPKPAAVATPAPTPAATEPPAKTTSAAKPAKKPAPLAAAKAQPSPAASDEDEGADDDKTVPVAPSARWRATEVKIHIESSPPGAAIYRGEAYFGQAPQTIGIDRGDYEFKFELRLPGYRDQVLVVRPLDDMHKRVKLERASPAPTVPSTSSAPITSTP